MFKREREWKERRKIFHGDDDGCRGERNRKLIVTLLPDDDDQ